MSLDQSAHASPRTAPERGGHRTIRENLQALHSAQKSGAGVPAYTRWVNRRAARIIAATAASLGLTPNQVTGLSAGLSAAGLAVLLIAGPQWWSALLCAVLLAAGYVFDSADGQVARLNGAGSPAGEWLDHVVDAARTPAIHLSIAVAVFMHRPDLLWAGGAAMAFAVLSAAQFMSQILAEQLVRSSGPEETSGPQLKQSLVLLPTDTGVLCWCFALWAFPPAFAVVYTGLFALNLVHAAASMLRKHRKLTSIA